MTAKQKAPIWFWVASTVALLWNALGVFAYFQQVLMSAEQFAALPQQQQDLLASQPGWVTAAFAIAVFAGFIAAIAMLMRKRLSVRLFLVSLLAVTIQLSSFLIVDGYREYVADQGWVMPVLIVAFALAFLIIARHAEKKSLLS